jgi:hypothetical protein
MNERVLPELEANLDEKDTIVLDKSRWDFGGNGTTCHVSTHQRFAKDSENCKKFAKNGKKFF